MTTADCIARLMRRKRIRQAELARQIDAPRSTVCELLKGRKEPNIEMVRRLADAFTCEVQDVIGDEPARPIAPKPRRRKRSA